MKAAFKYIRVDELEKFSQSEAFARFSTVPITRERIISQINNPRASASDVALILAENEDGTLLGFIGLLPDWIFLPVEEKVNWISCWWVDKEKAKNLGIPLLLAAYKASNGKLLADSIPETVAVFKNSKLFTVPEPQIGIRVFLTPCLQKIVARKRPQLARQPLIELANSLSMALFFPIGWTIKKTRKNSSLKYERMLFLTEQADNFLHQSFADNPFKRKKKDLNWILRYPWLSDSYPQDSTAIYPFSHKAGHFQNHCFLLFKNDRPVGFLFFTERDRSFKLPYAYFEKGREKEICQFIETLLYQLGAEEFTTFHPILQAELLQRFHFGYKHMIQYQYVWGKDVPLASTSHLQYGDGDAIFT